MIHVTGQKNGKVQEIMIEGHAGYAETGKDIICAGASILFYTLLEEMSLLEERGLAQIVELNIQSGSAKLRVLGKSQPVHTAFETVMFGYEILAEEYPEYIILSKVGVN